MKKFKFFLVLLFAPSFIFISCNKEITDVKVIDSTFDYSSEISQQRIVLGRSLVQAISENPELMNLTTVECNNKFDGDRNVLVKDLIKAKVGELKSTNSTFEDILNSYLIEQTKDNLKSVNNANIIQEFVSKDPFVQVYFYIGNPNGDTSSVDGVVILPSPYNDQDKKLLHLIKDDGTEGTIRSDIDPKSNYLVISQNERVNIEQSSSNLATNNLKSITDITDEPNYTVGHLLKVTNATFTSVDAKRQVESWSAGEPEVRLIIIWAMKNHSTNLMDPRYELYKYEKDWLNTPFLGTVTTKWIDVSIDCPYWYYYEHSYDRKLRWVEQDGGSCAIDYSTTVTTNPQTGDKTTISFKIPSSDGEDKIAESYIDYQYPGSGEVNWGLIKFILAYN